MNLSRFLKVLIFTSAFFICSANGAYAQLSITPVTWNVIGLDSNKPATDGPTDFPVGVKVCNTSSSALSNLNTTFYWDSTNTLINLDRGGTTQSITQPSIAANTCADVYFTVIVTRDTAAYNTSRSYHIESSATGVSAVSTPTPREIFVEKLVSQNRNSVNSIVGPTTVYVGQTYNYTVNGSTATNGYEQLEAFLNLSNVIFRILSVNTTYSVPVGATNDKIYADSCGWDNNPLNIATYRSCSTTGKAGGTLKTDYTVLILSAGTTTASTLIYDFSGSSYHYNSDFGTSISSITITALPGGSISGTVFNDVNGLTDSIVNGTATNTGNTLYANLLNSANNVVQSVLIPASGLYSFNGLNAGNYTVQLSINQGTVGNAAPVKALPAGWVNTGENIGSGAGSDGTPNGLLAVAVTTAAITNANFGIEQGPTATSLSAASQVNPGGTNSTTVPAGTFSGTDATAVTSIRITAFPANATSFTVGTITYYPAGTTLPTGANCPAGTTCANFPTTGGLTIASGANGNPTPTIKIDPVDGAITVAFNYVAVDAAGVESTGATASVPFSTVSMSGKVFDDIDGLTGGIANRLGTNTGAALYANLLDSANRVVQSVLVPASGVYSFIGLNSGSYTVQLSINQGTVGNAAPVKALPNGWVNTGENLGTGTGTDGTADGLIAVIVGAANVTDSNFGIEKVPVANNKTETIQNNPGGITNVTISPTMFTGSDTTPGTVMSIRLTTFPTNATTITINGIVYGATAGPGVTLFPPAGVMVPAGANGNPTQTISVDPIDGAVTVPIRFVTIDDAGIASSPDASAATVNVPFQLAPTAARGKISGTLFFGGNPVQNALVVLIDTASTSKVFARTDANGNYLFDGKTVGKTYLVQPLSSKYSFSPGTSVVNLVDNALDLNFDSTAKKYHPKNDFDGDGQSDIAVFRPSDGNWYVLKSSDGQLSSFQFGAETDVPVSGDFDGDGKTDYAVFRPENGVWYIWQSKTQDLRAEQFGLATDKLVPADYDGDGKDDIAVYRNGNWYIRRSSDDAFEAKIYGADTDTPITGDFDGDGKADLTVFRPENGVWYTLQSSNATSSAKVFGLATDVPLSGDFDGDGRADITQFRNGFWYVLNSTTDFEASRFGAGDGKSIVGDYDGDGRADTIVFRDGLWSIYNSGSGTVRNVDFGFPTDIPVK